MKRLKKLEVNPKRIYNLASRVFGVSEYTIEVYEKSSKIDFGSLSLQEIYGDSEKILKIEKDLSLIERRYKIEKLTKRFKNDNERRK